MNVVCITAEEFDSPLSAIAQSLGLDTVDSIEQGRDLAEYFLHQSAGVLQLTPYNSAKGGALFVDFSSAQANYRRQHSGIKQEVAKAVGCKADYRPRILDVTAGLGGDAFVLASVGCSVSLLEKNPLVHALLADGLRRARDLDCDVAEIVTGNMALLACQDSLEFLRRPELVAGAYDVLYLDPMFPQRQKTAKVKKAMQYFHDIVGLDLEQEWDLLEQARKLAAKRVVVKRPKGAELLANAQPSYQLQAKSIRYDIYLTAV